MAIVTASSFSYLQSHEYRSSWKRLSFVASIQTNHIHPVIQPIGADSTFNIFASPRRHRITFISSNRRLNMSIQNRDSATWERESDRSISQEPTMYDKQWVCTTCGYNMIGEMPGVCPFCGAHHHKFVMGENAEQIYRVTPHRVNDYVTQLLSVPRLGF